MMQICFLAVFITIATIFCHYVVERITSNNCCLLYGYKCSVEVECEMECEMECRGGV